MTDDNSKKVGFHQYKGIDVWYDDFHEMWECELERSHQSHISQEKLQDVRKRIDAFVKKERKFERYEVIVLTAYGFGLNRGDIVTVTSHLDDRDEGHCWVVDKKGSRSKERLVNLAPNTELSRMTLEGWEEVITEAENRKQQANRGIAEIGIGYEPEDEDED